MPTNTQRITSLEAWTKAHDAKHAANPLHPNTPTNAALAGGLTVTQELLNDHINDTPPLPEPPPPPPPPTGGSVTVTSLDALLAALTDNALTDFTLKAVGSGIYAARSRQLLIGARFAGRTKPAFIHADGVTLDGGGAKGWVGLHFTQGVHHQTWQGFRFANAEPTQVGVIVFGQSGSERPVPPHHITLLDTVIEESITSGDQYFNGDHAIYFSSCTAPMTDILIDRYTVKAATSGLDDALTFYVQPALGVGPQRVTVRHMTVIGTNQPITLWDASLRNIVIEDSTITNAKATAVRYELGGTVTLRRVTSTGSGQGGFLSGFGPNPPGVTFESCDLR